MTDVLRFGGKVFWLFADSTAIVEFKIFCHSPTVLSIGSILRVHKMSLVSRVLSFVGYGGDAQVVARGRRRVVTYMSFICFVLVAASLGDQEWVSGKSQITRYTRRNLAAFCPGSEAGFDASESRARLLQCVGSIRHRSLITGATLRLKLSYTT